MNPVLTHFFVLLPFFAVVELLIVRRHMYDGILYSDFATDSNKVEYSLTDPVEWENLEGFIMNGDVEQIAMFCTRGQGPWLLYQEEEFQYGNNRQLKLVYGEHCVAADNVKSLQPLGAMVYVNYEDNSAAVAFTETYFASKAESSRTSLSQDIKSAIFIGSGNWTVQIDGRKTCLIILSEGDVCLLEDIQNSFSSTSDSVTITKGCDSDPDMEQYHLQSCYSEGFHELTYDFDFTVPSMQSICSGGYDPDDLAKNKFLTITKLWMNRMNPATDADVVANTVPNAPQRLTTFKEMVNIMGKTCGAVRPSFLELIQEIYLIHIKNGELWNTTVLPDGTRIEQSHAKWQRAQSFIEDCANYGAEVETGCHPEDISAMKNTNEIATIEDFLNGEAYDFVIEHVWLLLNYVSTYCNYHMGFKNNDWAIFPLLFKRDFLYPLQEQWKMPGKWATYYPLMFNGYNMEEERRAMISCVQGIIKQTPFYDPLARPPGFYMGNNTVDRDIVGGVKSGRRNKRQPELDYDLEESLIDDDQEFRPTVAKSVPKTRKIATSPKTNVPGTAVNEAVGNSVVEMSEDGQPQKKLRRRRRKGRKGKKRRAFLLQNINGEGENEETELQLPPGSASEVITEALK